MDSIYLSIFLFFYSCFCVYSFFLPKINYSTLEIRGAWRGRRRILVLQEELVGRHLRTNPLDKYGVLLAYNIRPEPWIGGCWRAKKIFFAHSENGEHATK